MATIKPRMTISLDPDLYNVILEVSEITGKRKSEILSDLIEGAREPLKKLVHAVNFARSGISDELRKNVLYQLNKSQSDMFGVDVKSHDVIGDLLLQIKKEVKDGKN